MVPRGRRKPEEIRRKRDDAAGTRAALETVPGKFRRPHHQDPALCRHTLRDRLVLLTGSGLLDTVGIIVAILLATGISFYNEYRSSREFDVLNAHRDDMAVKVIRDGNPTLVPSRDIVVGDLILLEAGDAIPADGWLLAIGRTFL